MPAQYTPDCTIAWHGTSERTPPGHTLGIGTDTLGSVYLWLFKGPDAVPEAFVGSIHIPQDPDATPIAYNQGGGFAGTAPDTREALARLAAASGDTP